MKIIPHKISSPNFLGLRRISSTANLKNGKFGVCNLRVNQRKHEDNLLSKLHSNLKLFVYFLFDLEFNNFLFDFKFNKRIDYPVIIYICI